MTKNEQEVLYTQYCRENGVKPLESILIQLQEKRQHIQLSNLSKFEFGPVSLVLARNNGLLTLSMDQIQFDGDQLIYLLTNAKYLKRLVVKNCDFGYRSGVTEGIFTALPRNLTTLHLTNCKMSDSCLRSLTQAIRDGKICDISLDNNVFRDVRHVLDALASKKSICLSLKNCALPAPQRQFIMQFMTNAGNKIQYLQCSGNKFSTDGLEIDKRPQNVLKDSNQLPEAMAAPPRPQPRPQAQQVSTIANSSFSTGGLQRQNSFLRSQNVMKGQQNLILSQQMGQNQNKTSLTSPRSPQERSLLPFREYVFLDIQEQCDDFNTNMNDMKHAGPGEIERCVEIAQQIIISIINKLQEFQNETIDIFKQNFLGYQQLQRLVQERQNQISDLYEQKIYRLQQENMQKAQQLSEKLHDFNETYIKDKNFDLQDNQVQLYTLEKEINELQIKVKQLREEKIFIQEQINAKEIEINNSSIQSNAILQFIMQKNDIQIKNDVQSWKETMKQKLQISIKDLSRKVEDRKACLAELLAIYEEGKNLGMQ